MKTSQNSHSPLRLLVIGAHPADIFDQSGGTMAHHRSRGDWVGCVILTHGARIHDRVLASEMFHRDEVPTGEALDRLLEERGSLKGQEVREGCRMLGVEDLEFLDVDDAVLVVEPALVRRLAKIIRKTKPDVIITHYPKENGGVANPHAVAGEITMYALALAASVDVDDSRPPHNVTQVFYFGTGAASIRSGLWSSEGGFHNDVFVDISDVIELKHAALNMLDSQGYAGAYARKRIETSDGAFGNAAGVGYAEGFISLRSTTHYYLPVSAINRELAKLSDHEALMRRSQRYTPPADEDDAEVTIKAQIRKESLAV